MLTYIADATGLRRVDGECTHPGCIHAGPYDGRCAEHRSDL